MSTTPKGPPPTDEIARIGEIGWYLRMRGMPENITGTIQWKPLAWDMNVDGAVTISDAVLWANWAFGLPYDLIIFGAMRWLPSVAQFLEISPKSMGSEIGGILAWIAIFSLYFMISSLLNDLFTRSSRP